MPESLSPAEVGKVTYDVQKGLVQKLATFLTSSEIVKKAEGEKGLGGRVGQRLGELASGEWSEDRKVVIVEGGDPEGGTYYVWNIIQTAGNDEGGAFLYAARCGQNQGATGTGPGSIHTTDVLMANFSGDRGFVDLITPQGEDVTRLMVRVAGSGVK